MKFHTQYHEIMRGTGAWMLREKKTKIDSTGCLREMKEYNVGAGGPINVDGSWTEPLLDVWKRGPQQPAIPRVKAHVNKSVDVNVLEVRQFVTSLVPTASLLESTRQSTSSTISVSSNSSSMASAVVESSSVPDSSVASSSPPSLSPTSVSNTTACNATTTVTNCQSTAIISGTATQTFATACSTLAACPLPSLANKANNDGQPSYTLYVHPAPSENWDSEQACVLALMEKPDIDDKALAACFSKDSNSGSATASVAPTNAASSVFATATQASETPSETPSSASPAESSSSPSATPELGVCTLNPEDAQCQCFPAGCSPDSPGCAEQILNVGENGCADDCENCMITPSKF
jgi:hypothetical protein